MTASFCGEVLGAPLALGAICRVERSVTQAVEAPVEAARRYGQSHAANVDATMWWEERRRGSLWVAVTQWGSVFAMRASRGAKVLRELVGKAYGEVVSSDRAKAYNRQPVRRRQLWWAHLRRDFPARLARGGAGAEVGRRLLADSTVLFEWWHWVRDGTWPRATLQR